MGIRGKKFDNTLFGIIEEPEISEDDLRGRDPELIRKRNEHLLYRYVYEYSKNPLSDYNWKVEMLSKDFYLSPSRIGQLIMANMDQIAAIKKENLHIRQVRRRFPWW